MTYGTDFIPNDDIGKLRKHRMRKTLERGAVRVKEWRDDVDFVVVDIDIGYQDILKHLRLSRLPVSALVVHRKLTDPQDSISVVNATFVPECIEAQALLDPRRGRFHVKGYSISLEGAASVENALTAPTSPAIFLPTFPSQALETPTKTETRDEEAAGHEVDRLSRKRATDDEPAATSPDPPGEIRLERAIADCRRLQELVL